MYDAEIPDSHYSTDDRPTAKEKHLDQKTRQRERQSNCILLKKIQLNEQEIFSKKEQKNYFSQYLYRCATPEVLKAILHTTAEYYIDNGYITTKPYLPLQNIKSGTLRINILKGYLRDIINSETNTSDNRIATAFAFQKGNILNLRDMETSLEMMNRVPSYHATFQIVPAAQRGESVVKIQTERKRPFRLTIGATGERHGYETNPYLSADFSIDNPLEINDILTLRYNGSRIQSYYQSSSGSDMDYSFPVGSYLFTYTWFQFRYSQRVIGINDTYRASGNTVGSNFKISKTLFRNQSSKIETALSLQYKNNKNYFSNELIDVSSYKTALVQVDLAVSYFQNWGEFRNTVSCYCGTDWFGARNDGGPDVVSDEKLQFNKFSLDTLLSYRIGRSDWRFDAHLHLQYTDDLLYDNDKLRVGSYYTVRGYDASYYGNNGYYLHNDLTRVFYPETDKRFLQSLSPFIGVDYGAVQCEKNTQQRCGTLYGVAAGIKSEAEMLSTEFTFSKGLKHATGQKPQNLFRYSVNFVF